MVLSFYMYMHVNTMLTEEGTQLKEDEREMTKE